MLALHTKPREMIFFKFHSHEDVLEMVKEGYEELQHEGEWSSAVSLVDVMGYMTEAFLKEQIYQASIGEIKNAWYTQEECLEAMRNDDKYEEMRDTFNETFSWNGGFEFGLRYEGFERDFKKDIVRILDEYQMNYLIEKELDQDGQVMLELEDTRFYHSPIQEVW